MTKKIGLMALGLSMVFLSGCGSSNNDGGVTTPPDTNLNTPAAVRENIVGTWMTGCVSDGDGSWKDALILNADGSGSFEGQEYSAIGCNEGDLVSEESANFTYTIGEATTGSEGEEAVEIDVALEGEDIYTMVHVTAVNTFQMAGSDEGDVNDGETPETRENRFYENEVFTRQ